MTIYEPDTVTSILQIQHSRFPACHFHIFNFHSLEKLPACLGGVMSSPLQWSDGRKGHPQVSSSALCCSPSSYVSLSLGFPVSLASGIFVSLPHCGCK